MEYLQKVKDLSDGDREALHEEFREISNALWVRCLKAVTPRTYQIKTIGSCNLYRNYC